MTFVTGLNGCFQEDAFSSIFAKKKEKFNANCIVIYRMKKLILSIFSLLVLSLGTYGQFCYTPNWAEPSLDSMLIYVSMASLNGANLQSGDAIGVFDGTECVGLGVLSGELTGAPNYLIIEVSRDNPGTADVDGFINGHTITYRFCLGGNVVNPSVTPAYITNGPNFTINDSCIVQLSAMNTAPTVTSIPDTVATEDLPYSSLITATDIDIGDILTFSAPLPLPTWLLFDEGTQVLSGDPGNAEVGYHDVTLRITDGTATVDTTFTIRVANVNDAPTFTTVPDTMALEDVLYTSSVAAVDIDGDTLTFTAPVLPAWLNFNDTTNILSGTPENDDVGDHLITLRINDGTVNVDSSFVLHVENANDAPTFTILPDTMALQDVLYSSAVEAADIDIGDTLTFTTTLLPAWLNFNDVTNTLSGTPVNDDVGDHLITLRINDGTVNVDTSFVIHVVNTNDAPNFTFAPDTVAMEDALYSSAITAEDIDGDTLTFTAPLLPAWLNFNDVTNILSGTPANDDVGDDTVTLRIFDGTINVDSTIIIHVENVNDAPTFTSIPVTTGLQGALYTYNPTAEDIDIGDTLSFSAPVLPSWLAFDTTTHILSGTPDNDHVGDHNVSLRVNDGTVDVIQSFTIAVGNVNDPPTITSTPVTEARPGVAYEYTVTAVDIDGDALSYTARVLPGWLTFNPTAQLLSATPGEGDIGDQHVTIRVSDGSLYVDHTFVISVSFGNHAPTFTSDPATSVVVSDSYVYTVTAHDIDGDALTYTAPVLPDWLTFYPATHVISGIPRTGDIGRHDVTLRVTDGTVTADQSFPIYVEDENIEPEFTSTPVLEATVGELYVYYASAEDGDGDDLIFNAPVLPDWLSFDFNTQVLHGTPNNDDVGDHNVTLMVSDGDAAENQSFIITVDFKSAVGIDDAFSSDYIKIYPNPSDGRFFVELTYELQREFTLELLDPLGRVMLQEQFPPYTLIKEEYNLSDRSAGIYFIRVYHESAQTLRKLLIH